MSASPLGSLKRLLGLVVLAAVCLQIYFFLRVAAMHWIDPQSTAFQRSEIARLAWQQHEVLWAQQWRPYGQISNHLKAAVIASEDSGFVEHSGVEWDALESAWERNERAQALAARRNAALEKRSRRHVGAPAPPVQLLHAKVVGGSTISQQLAKNLFLSGERHFVRKGQELLITFMLEAVLSKQRILELYLNNVEWGEGVYGAQAAARHYFHEDAADLSAYQAARLAVMLPAPKRFEKRPDSAYVRGRAAVIVARMPDVVVP
jgi:monofunctional biosynthetic peptidoglycan transglycosylase